MIIIKHHRKLINILEMKDAVLPALALHWVQTNYNETHQLGCLGKKGFIYQQKGIQPLYNAATSLPLMELPTSNPRCLQKKPRREWNCFEETSSSPSPSQCGPLCPCGAPDLYPFGYILTPTPDGLMTPRVWPLLLEPRNRSQRPVGLERTKRWSCLIILFYIWGYELLKAAYHRPYLGPWTIRCAFL